MINYNAALPPLPFMGKSSINVNNWMGEIKGNLTYLVRSIFANNEQGFAYDPNDLTTLYQDTAGTIPVTAAGQPVGLMLDKGGMSRVTPLLDFSYDLVLLDGGAVKNADGTYTVSNNGYVRFNVPLVMLEQNAMYEVTIEVLSITGTGNLDWCDLGQVMISGTEGIYKTRARRDYTSIYNFSDVGATIGSTITFKFLGIRMVAGNHAYQTASASRPILQRNATTGAYYLAFDGVDDFLITGSINLTMTDKLSVFAGVRKLQDGQFGTILEHGYNTDSDGSFTLKSATGNGYYMQCGALGNRTLMGASGGGGAPRIDVVAFQMDRSKTDVSELKYAINTNTLASNSVVIDSSGATGSFINLPAYIGRRSGTTLPFNGHLYSLIGIGRITTDIETVVLVKSIAKNTGVTLNA